MKHKYRSREVPTPSQGKSVGIDIEIISRFYFLTAMTIKAGHSSRAV
jgi:hypothetical protein